MRIYIKGRNAKNKTEVTNSAISVKWSGDKASCSRRVDASLAADDNGKFSFPCEIMDDVSLYGDKGLLFSGIRSRAAPRVPALKTSECPPCA